MTTSFVQSSSFFAELNIPDSLRCELVEYAEATLPLPIHGHNAHNRLFIGTQCLYETADLGMFCWFDMHAPTCMHSYTPSKLYCLRLHLHPNSHFHHQAPPAAWCQIPWRRWDTAEAEGFVAVHISFPFSQHFVFYMSMLLHAHSAWAGAGRPTGPSIYFRKEGEDMYNKLGQLFPITIFVEVF